jgi:hypothetical protein
MDIILPIFPGFGKANAKNSFFDGNGIIIITDRTFLLLITATLS